jgi:hypothetical protein
MGGIIHKQTFLGPGLADQKLKTFASVAQALEAIPVWQREIGQPVTVLEDGKAVVYWWYENISNAGLVKKENAGGIEEAPNSETEVYVRGSLQWVKGVTRSVFDAFKLWVEGKLIEPYQSITITSGATTWDCETGLNKRVIADGNFTLNITNLNNGQSGALTLYCSAVTTVTLITGKTNAGNGSLTALPIGNYVFAFTFDGDLFFYNIADYA